MCGLMLNPSDGTAARLVNVHDEDDWKLIYKNPKIRVKCRVESCDTLLTPKRMSRSGLRFLAIRSGGCSHNLVKIPILDQDVEQDPATLVGDGGPEGDEHLWVKGRLFRIGRLLGLDPIEEDGRTRADVYLAKPGIALEYQRWDTDFTGRAAQRARAGAEVTVWLFPAQRPGLPTTKRAAAFRQHVWEAGGIYLSVKNVDNRREHQTPWEHAAQERTARLYASGSIVVFDPKLGHLVRRELSIATVLREIANGERTLRDVPVYTKATGRVATARVWVNERDLKSHQARRAQVQTERDTKTAAESAPVGGHPSAPTANEPVAPGERTARATALTTSEQASPEVARFETPNPQRLTSPDITVPATPPLGRASDLPRPRTTWWSKLRRLLGG